MSTIIMLSLSAFPRSDGCSDYYEGPSPSWPILFTNYSVGPELLVVLYVLYVLYGVLTPDLVMLLFLSKEDK